MTVLSTEALTSVADVKELLGISAGSTSKDNLITRNINYATKIILNYCRRTSFNDTVYTEYYDGIGGTELVLRNRPVISVTSVAYNTEGNSTGAYTTLDSDDYFVDLEAGIIKSQQSFVGNYHTWKVIYTAGYTAIPDDVAEACARMAAYMTEQGTAGTNVKKRQEGQRSVEYFDTQGGGSSLLNSLGLDEILEPYGGHIISGLN